jgi:5-methyltetrahydrofolate--homocysteine methyltransferase
MNRLLSILPDGPVLADGAWGTELQKLGLGVGQPSDPWNLTHPAAVRAVARSYVEAGSRILLTNTFQASRPALDRVGMSASWREVNREGVQLSRSVADSACLVFGSIGPCGRSNDIAPKALSRIYQEQAEVLAGDGVDALVLETFCDQRDALVAARACGSIGLPLILSFAALDRLADDSILNALARLADEAEVDALGLNCGSSLTGALALLNRLSRITSLPIWFKPTAGCPDVLSPEYFASEIIAATPSLPLFLGGCCGAGPEHIACLASGLSRATA